MTSTSLRSSRVGRGLVLAALSALALTACGTENAGGGTSAGAGSTQVAAPTPTATPASTPSSAPTPTAPATDPADDPNRTPEEQAAELRFMQLVVRVAEPCTEGLPTVPPPAADGPPPAPADGPTPPDAPPPPSTRPGDVVQPDTVPDTVQASEQPWNFERARQEQPLSGVEKCAAPLHGKRVTQALDGRTAATPAAVTKALHGIGYDIDYRIDGPHRSGSAVSFTLDLRSLGSQLCLAATFDGTRTTLDPYGVSPEVRCSDVKRRA
ncbi:hypothetical protein [Streptomyces sp. NPDC056361]|uniref:hypothetical protein n=1 Tax=Streptomyces sp. NPDC056361 TaxID=3345795 RepID=UPI0035E25197